MSDYDDDYYYGDGYDDDYEGIGYWDDNARPALAWRLKILWWGFERRVVRLVGWLMWHNRKCEYCGKPAIADGKVCLDHDIPF
jgi:hypothetical protein